MGLVETIMAISLEFSLPQNLLPNNPPNHAPNVTGNLVRITKTGGRQVNIIILKWIVSPVTRDTQPTVTFLLKEPQLKRA
jgi:hypothetical protein